MKKTLIFFTAFAICLCLYIYSENNFSKVLFSIVGLFYFVNSMMYFIIFFYKNHVKKRIFLFITYTDKNNQIDKYVFFAKPITPKNLSIKDFNDWIYLEIEQNHKINNYNEITPLVIDVKNISTEYYFV